MPEVHRASQDPPTVLSKVCPACHIEKPLTDFSPDKRKKDGRQTHCRQCHATMSRAYRASKKGPASPPPSSKTCTKCSVEKPLKLFYREKRHRDGYTSACKACHNQSIKEKHFDTLQRRFSEGQASFPSAKVCSICKVEKTLDNFARDKYRQDGYEIRCKECIRRKDSAFRAAHSQRLAMRARIYYHAHRGQRQAYNRAYYSLYHAAHPEKARERRRRWEKNNPLKRRQKYMRYLARKRRASLGTVSYERILARDGYNCHICGSIVTPETLHFDHVIPLKRGGPHSEENIKVSHGVCNDRKGTRLLEEMTPFQRRGIS